MCTTHLQLVPKLRMSGAIPLHPRMPSWNGQGTFCYSDSLSAERNSSLTRMSRSSAATTNRTWSCSRPSENCVGIRRFLPESERPLQESWRATSACGCSTLQIPVPWRHVGFYTSVTARGARLHCRGNFKFWGKFMHCGFYCDVTVNFLEICRRR